MGQYYRIAYKNNGNDKVYTNDRKVEGIDYVMAKLMEHSYLGNYLMDSVAGMLENQTTRLAWVGDYADEKNEDGEEELVKATKGDICYADVWGENPKNPTELKKVNFNYQGKYFVNYSKREYISFDDYMNESDINPISILTCLGNGLGGGDYEGTNMEYVGTWIWDLVGIVSKDKLPLEGFKELKIYFVE